MSSSKEELPSSQLWFLSSRREGLFALSLLPTDGLAYTLLARGLYKNRGRIIIYPSQGSRRHEHGARFEIMQTFGVRRDLRLLSTHLEREHPIAKVNSKTGSSPASGISVTWNKVRHDDKWTPPALSIVRNCVPVLWPCTFKEKCRTPRLISALFATTRGTGQQPRGTALSCGKGFESRSCLLWRR